MYHGRTLKVLNTLVALSAATMLAVNAYAATSTGATLVFNYPNGFTGSYPAIRTAYSGQLQAAALNLTGVGVQHEAGAAWYTTPQNITSFTTDFTFQIQAPSSVPAIQGITFCVQNTNSTSDPTQYGDNAVGDANLSGYGAYALSGQFPLINSVAVAFDLNNHSQTNYPASGSPNSTGLFINSGPGGHLIPEIDLNPSGINLYSGHTMSAHIVYDGSLLTMTLLDTVTNAQLRASWPVNIPAVLGGSTGWVGFTGGEITPLSNNVLTWSFSQGYAPRLSAPTFSVAAGSYTSAQTVSISGPAGATIYYTTNGQQPTSSSTRYTGPITVSSSRAVQAVAIETGYTDSLVATANYQIAPTATPLINFPSGFGNAANLVTVNGTALFNGSALQLTDTARNGEVGTAWYAVPVNVQSFTTSFTLKLSNAQANGMTFTLQNQPPASSDTSILDVSGGPNALANYADGLGYSGGAGTGAVNSGLLSSAAVIFDLYSGSGNMTGLYTNGAALSGSSIDMTSSGLSLHSGNPLNVTLNYNGTNLSMTITDSSTKASFSKSWAINIPSTVGGNTAYVGFTGATGGLTAQQQITSWTYSTSSGQTTTTTPVPNAPTNVAVQ
jgi:Legume lectin domain/Chitobiase/beta-hexosaminidase C-terminal domain